jgi:filamin
MINLLKLNNFYFVINLVDASQAGTGQLEIAVENGKIPCNFTNQGNLKFIPAFTPREPGKHNISIKFNGFEVPGSPFTCQVVDLNRVTLLNHDTSRPFKFSINRQNSIELNANESFNPNINATLTSISGKSVSITRSITPNGNLKLSFVATEVG